MKSARLVAVLSLHVSDIFSKVISRLNERSCSGCGPTTLNAVVRKAVAAQIDPSRMRQGDKSGSIDLVVEEFGY
jgi:hypothetical protein